jgi:hypothetical protein
MKYRIECENNSDARGFKLLDGVAETTRHNGGKIVICTVDDRQVARAEAILDASHKVRSYTAEVAA